MTAELDVRRRRAAYRATYRGTKELDWMVGRYAEAHLPAMDDARLTRFELLLALPEPQLQSWLLAPADSPPQGGEFADLVAAIRQFHGAAPPTGNGQDEA